MSAALNVRAATAADAGILARHRAEMFRDMGEVAPGTYDALVAASRAFFEQTVAAGMYRGWLATDPATQTVVAGVGLMLRERLPRPDRASGAVEARAEGYVLNVYTEPAWRRRGVARRLMDELIAWAKAHEIGRLTLHASAQGHGLYERLGFRATNEMRLVLGPGPGAARG